MFQDLLGGIFSKNSSKLLWMKNKKSCEYHIAESKAYVKHTTQIIKLPIGPPGGMKCLIKAIITINIRSREGVGRKKKCITGRER
jgi:hypothetical protein